MELADLTAYAKAQFHIDEQRKWESFPGFSVLVHPRTGKWLALLMRQWDSDSGVEIQRCDIKCGKDDLPPLPCLTSAFRMKGASWVGVVIDEKTDRNAVLRLFDRAFEKESQSGFTIVLEHPKTTTVIHKATTLPKPPSRLSEAELSVPPKIREMQRLYSFGDGTFQHRCRVFFRQGKLMENYTDDYPWADHFQQYFATYHDLSVPQLRGYFSWRTLARQGDYQPIAPSLATIYLYELLNLIGADSPQDSLEKMKAFEAGFLDKGYGDDMMRKNLRRWMMEFCVLHDVPPQTAVTYISPEVLAQDRALPVLQNPDDNSDDAVFEALCLMEGKRLRQSPVAALPQGKRLLAAVWRLALKRTKEKGNSLFAACFGSIRTFPWRPLANAVYRKKETPQDREYILNDCHRFICRNGLWQEEKYDALYFHKAGLQALLHEADRQLRMHYHTGRNLRAKADEVWAAPYIEEVLAAEIKAEQEALRPKINIDLSGLEKIRRDAMVTRDSLLTEEETEPEMIESPAPESVESAVALDETHRQIVMALLGNEAVDKIIQDHHLMPSVVADTINEAFFDEIGDMVVECDDALSLIEDYREDVAALMGGNNR